MRTTDRGQQTAGEARRDDGQTDTGDTHTVARIGRQRSVEGLTPMTTTRGMTVAIAAALAAFGATAAMAQAPGAGAAPRQELSDKSVAKLMDYAWAVVPAIFRTPTGRVIEIDRKKPETALVPVDTARDVIRAGYMSAQAQICDLLDKQVDNYNALMAREIAKKKWSEQQLLYISTLHRMTIHMAAGKLKVEEKGTDELKVTLEPLEPSKTACPDERKKQVSETITQYVAGAPKREAGAPAPLNVAPTTSAVQPAAAKEKPAAKDKK